MRQVHVAGERAFIDYSGKKLRVTDRKTGQSREVELFVMVMGASNYTFAEASLTQRLADFVGSTIRGFEYFGGVTELVVPDNLKALDGKLVKIPGFIVPLEDYEEEGAEFLLVPYYGACVHTPPPPPNQMVYVRMEGNRKIKFGWWDPVWMEGTLQIESYDSPYGAVGYQLVGTKTSPYAPK